ncbi:MAG TPA: bifunctional glycosyltransferase family 2 protein/CDP-glycerol:glycerophosphate glycerophosphotransferase [Streptosporangiaceae bacterium]|jgi:CDP-glycerol glycerophosphotransferase
MSADSQITLSVVVPVHKVQGYLRECLHSILDEAGSNLEVIAIDDKSPDGCGEILDEFGERDSRVRVKHLEENVGLGEARNIGLGLATGEYVWFVDSDDSLPEGTIPAVFERLAETTPDVLMIDYARTYWTGRANRNVLQQLFRVPESPNVFTLRERPDLLQILPFAWNRVIRREFLLEQGLRFTKGFYEDSPVSYPVLLAAERISMLDRVCYHYRQRRSGQSITKTRNAKHLDVFGQYEKIWAFIDHLESSGDDFRAIMFDRMMWHLLIVFAKEDRVPRDLRREFFAGMHKLYRHRPADHVVPGGLQGLKYRLVERDAYRLFSLFKVANLGRILVHGRFRGVRRGLRRTVSLARRYAKRVYYRVQLRLPMDDKLAVYGSYWYRGYSCNPRAIYERAAELVPNVKGVWVVRKAARMQMPEGVPYVIDGTRAYFRLMARAKYLVNNVNFPDEIIKRRGSIHLQTQHGTPLKTMGLDQMKFPVGASDMDFDELLRRSDRWDYLLSANPLTTEVWSRVFPCPYEMIEYGYPRNDRFFTVTDDETARLRAEFGIPDGKTAILYAPTHRDYMAKFQPMFDIGRFVRELGDDYVLLLRAHYFYPRKDLARIQGWPEGRVIDVSRHPTIEDLCVASDVLLTDYSSIMFDYANLDKPIVVYANDWDTYKRTRGVYFELPEEPPGAVAMTEDELVETFRSGIYHGDIAAKAHEEFRRRFCRFDDGHAAERVVRKLFLGEEPRTGQ